MQHTPRVVDDFVGVDAHCVWLWMCVATSEEMCIGVDDCIHE